MGSKVMERWNGRSHPTTCRYNNWPLVYNSWHSATVGTRVSGPRPLINEGLHTSRGHGQRSEAIGEQWETFHHTTRRATSATSKLLNTVRSGGNVHASCTPGIQKCSANKPLQEKHFLLNVNVDKWNAHPPPTVKVIIFSPKK
ncbi:hypothetical protein J6590_020937 [Homalodisca vitripennis]|nr:hypothetical protein J6590_020937 [Homalodisca vitripennis]